MGNDGIASLVKAHREIDRKRRDRETEREREREKGATIPLLIYGNAFLAPPPQPSPPLPLPKKFRRRLWCENLDAFLGGGKREGDANEANFCGLADVEDFFFGKMWLEEERKVGGVGQILFFLDTLEFSTFLMPMPLEP